MISTKYMNIDNYLILLQKHVLKFKRSLHGVYNCIDQKLLFKYGRIRRLKK